MLSQGGGPAPAMVESHSTSGGKPPFPTALLQRVRRFRIVLVYDKVSFVSAKSWVENPKLKQAALS